MGAMLAVLRCDDPGAERRGKIFALPWTKIELHILALEIASAPIIHNRVAGNVACRIFNRNIFAFAPNNAGYLQLDVSSL